VNHVPKVTVVIPVYNRERYVAGAIDSILAQSFTDFELLLIDDGSSDRSLEVMRSYRDPRIRVVCNQNNEGIPFTRNKGLRLARGTYLAMLDSDDYSYPHRLQKELAFLETHRDYALVGSWTTSMDEEGRSTHKIKILPVSPEEIRARLLFRCSVLQYSMMGRTAVLRTYGYREQFVVSQDFDLFVRVAEKHKLGNLPWVLVRRRLHGGRVTREKADLVKQMCMEIIANQLSKLRLGFDDFELERHYVLARLNPLGFAPDLEYLDWADDWMRRLQEANRRVRRYSEDAFALVLGEIWLTACWYGSKAVGSKAWTRFARSPLSRAAASSVKGYLSSIAFRRPPPVT